MATERTIVQRSGHVLVLIVADITGRWVALREAWVLAPQLFRRYALEAWAAIVRREIRAAVQQERDRCEEIVRTLPDWNDPEARGDAQFLIAHPEPDPAEPPEQEQPAPAAADRLRMAATGMGRTVRGVR